MAAAHAAGRTLQWMRSAPKPGRGVPAQAIDDDFDVESSDFLRPSRSSHHFKTLDADGMAAQQEEIDPLQPRHAVV